MSFRSHETSENIENPLVEPREAILHDAKQDACEQATAAQETRERKMTEKGREYVCSLKRKAALDIKEEFLKELFNFEKRIADFNGVVELNKQITLLSGKMNFVSKALDEWLKLSLDENEILEAIEMRSFLSDKLLSTQSWAQEYAVKFSQQKQETISTTSRRSSSNSSHIDTLVNLKARKAALGKRMQYFRLISEQERKLEQLKMQGEFEEVSAQESVYETLTETGNILGTM